MIVKKTANIENKTDQNFNFLEGEVLNINKPSGWTSFDVVKKIRNLVRVKKVGHAGTLDPFATGVLVVCTGKATKKINEFVDASKEYVGEIFLGAVTDSYDVTGKIIEKTENLKAPTIHSVHKILEQFKGDIHQIPPMFSALKVNGKRLYQYARQGKTIAREPRQVTIFDLELLDYQFPVLKIRVHCSKGTYIRTLAYDIGKLLGTGGYLKSLVRTKVGDHTVENSWSLDDFAEKIRDIATWM